MVDCDMCGKKGIPENKVKIEGTIMTVCATCARYGEKLIDPQARVNNFSRQQRKRHNPDEDNIIVANYASIIKSAREKKGLKQEEVAKQLQEKESVLHSIEANHRKPNFTLARKLERFFKVTLIENIEQEKGTFEKSTEKATPLTMEEKVLAALKKKS